MGTYVYAVRGWILLTTVEVNIHNKRVYHDSISSVQRGMSNSSTDV